MKGLHEIRCEACGEITANYDITGGCPAILVAALDSERYTRLGAALCHVTAQLTARRERRRALLLISDGRPYDADRYGGEHGIEDTRRAVLEARGAGLCLFCLAVEGAGAPHLPRIFGSSSGR